MQQFSAVLLFLTFALCGRSQQQIASLGDFKTTGGGTITGCKIGYRMIGSLNSAKDNAILWPTWFGGSSEQIINYALSGTLDTSAGYCIIIVDALGNGVSSSPSNTAGFPEISIRDMVNAEHLLLTKFLNIRHLKAVVGVSMGGMQAFEWLVAYPDFMDKAISIVGTPKQSAYDLSLWHTEAAIIERAGKDPAARAAAMAEVLELHQLHLETPSFWLRTETPENFKAKLKQEKVSKNPQHPDDWVCQINAMMGQDIYTSAGIKPTEVKNKVQAKVLVIAAKQDQMVNPASSVAFAKALGCELLEPDNDCGHLVATCAGAEIKAAIEAFLKK